MFFNGYYFLVWLWHSVYCYKNTTINIFAIVGGEKCRQDPYFAQIPLPDFSRQPLCRVVDERSVVIEQNYTQFSEISTMAENRFLGCLIVFMEARL